ncbi:MAG: PAS domain S-box protein, partial [Marinobacter sp.]
MVNSRNVTIFWLCAILALAIALGTIGLGILYDAISAGDGAGQLSLRPGGGLLAIVLSIGFLAVVFRKRWLATGLSVTVLILALAFSALATLPEAQAIRKLAINPALLLVTTLIAISLLTAIWWRRGGRVGMAAAAVCLTIGLLSLLSQWYPALAGFSLGSMAESTVVVSPLAILCGFTLPFLHQVFHRQADISFRGLLVVGAIGIVITTLSWHVLRLQQSQQVLERAQALADQLEVSSTSAHAVNLALIRRLAERWELLDGLPPPAFLNLEIDSYLRDFPELRLLTVLDPKQRPVMIEARDLEYRFWLHEFLQQPEFPDWLDHVIKSRTSHMSHPQQTEGGRAHAAIAMPITPVPGLSWTLIAVVDLTRIFQGLTQHLNDNLSVRVSAYGLTLFDQAGPEPSYRHTLLLSRTVNVHQDNEWTLHISMPGGVLPPGELYLPPLVLFSGLILSFLLMLSHLFWRESVRRSESLQRLNNTLNYHLDQERTLRSTNERILEFSRDILCSISREGIFLQISPACQDILGYTPKELQGQHYDPILMQEDRAATEEEVRLLVSGDHDKAQGFRTRLRHRDGSIVTLSWTAEWSRTDNTLFCVGRDISDELMAETLTRERDQFFSLSPDMFCIVDLNSYFFEVNNTFVDTLGYSRAELLGTSYLRLVHEPDQQAVHTAVQSLTEGLDVSDLHIRISDVNGTLHWLNINAILSADDLIYVVARDTTEQRRIEQKLKENEDLLKMAERVAMLGGWVVDLQTGQSTWSDAICAIHEVPAGQAPAVDDALLYYLPE